jgi:hypothetical protein
MKKKSIISLLRVFYDFKPDRFLKPVRFKVIAVFGPGTKISDAAISILEVLLEE